MRKDIKDESAALSCRPSMHGARKHTCHALEAGTAPGPIGNVFRWRCRMHCDDINSVRASDSAFETYQCFININKSSRAKIKCCHKIFYDIHSFIVYLTELIFRAVCLQFFLLCALFPASCRPDDFFLLNYFSFIFRARFLGILVFLVRLTLAPLPFVAFLLYRWT